MRPSPKIGDIQLTPSLLEANPQLRKMLEDEAAPQEMTHVKKRARSHKLHRTSPKPPRPPVRKTGSFLTSEFKPKVKE